MTAANAVAIIPARLAATRFPRKPLVDIHGKPMIQHVYERTQKVSNISRVLVATPDEEIAAVVRAFGGEAILTSPDCPTGTDRIAQAAATLPAKITVIANVQGDEPMVDPSSVEAMVAALFADNTLSMATVCCPLPPERIDDPNAVKVVRDRFDNALYFSRSPLPYRRVEAAPYSPKLHLGLYAYRRDFLQSFATLEPTPLERIESLEQLRALENGHKIRVIEIDRSPQPVDTPEDLKLVLQLLASA